MVRQLFILLTVVACFSKTGHFLPLSKLPSAKETPDILVRQVYQGLSCDIASDPPPHFTFTVWKSFCSAICANISQPSGIHPQTNSQSERTNQKPQTTRRCPVPADPSTWASKLSMVESDHHTLPTSDTGLVSIPVPVWLSVSTIPFSGERHPSSICLNPHRSGP